MKKNKTVYIVNRFSGQIVDSFIAGVGVDLRNKKLAAVSLRDRKLQRANMQGADLRQADLSCSDLRGADLTKVDLYGAVLRNADLRKADLRGARLDGAYLEGANLEGAKLSKFQIPQRKSLIVYKKVVSFSGSHAIAKLRIPARAKRTATPTGKKCRAERAFVLEIVEMIHCNQIVRGNLIQRACSYHDPYFYYEVGKEVSPRFPYNGDIRIECTSGIHFFMKEEDAREY